MTMNALRSAKNMGAAFILIFTSIAVALASTVAAIRNNWKVYLIVGIAGVALFGISENSQTLLVNFDQFATKVILPVYNEILAPIVNILCVLAEILAPWWNYVWEMIFLIPRSTFIVLRDCVHTIDGKSMIQSIILFLQSIFTFLAAILADLEADLLISPIYVAGANIVAQFSPWVNCFCQEAAFAWNVALFYISQDNFQKSGGPTGFLVIFPPSHDLLNAILNFVRPFLRFAATVVIDAIDGGSFDPFDCGSPISGCDVNFNGTCNAYVDCMINRPPYFGIAFDYTCDFFDHYLGQFDDIIWALVLLFINASADQVPRFFAILAPIGCFFARFLRMGLDFILKIDLFFNPIVKYASRIKVSLPFDELRRSALAVEVFFDTFQVEALHTLGCGISEFYRGAIGILQFLVEFLVSFASFDLDYIGDFLKNYPYTSSIMTHLEVSTVCVEQFLKIFNDEWASAYKWTVILAIRVINIVVLTFSRFKLLFSGDPIDYFVWYADEVIPEAFRTMDVAQRWTIALGNCMRTFDTFLVEFGMNENCIQPLTNTYPLPNGTAVISGVDTHSNLFCVTGDAIQTGFQFVVSLIQLPVILLLSIVRIIVSPTLSQFYSLLRALLDQLKFFVFKSIKNGFAVLAGYLSCIGSFFGCQDSDGNFTTYSGVPTVGTKLKLFFGAVLNVTNFPLDSTILTGEVLGLTIQCATDPTSIPIFLQDLTGCESATIGGENIGPPPITTCAIQGLFDDLINIICRYVYLTWDYLWTWVPLIVVRLVDFILCLAQEGTANNNYFSGFFSAIQTIRCVLCDIVRIIVAIIRAFVFLFSGNFNAFINIVSCFPPINTIAVVIKTIVYCLSPSNIIQLISGEITFSSVYNAQKGQLKYFCAPTRPPCGLAPGTPRPSGTLFIPTWPPLIDPNSPYLPCYIVNTFLFKRSALVPALGKRTTGTPSSLASEYTTLPLDGQILLVTDGWKWNISNPLYNYTQPESPCYADYQLVLLTGSTIDPTSTNYWLNKIHKSDLQQCIISSVFANNLNAMFPLAREFPIPPNIHQPVVLFGYLLNFMGHMKDAFGYISFRIAEGGSSVAQWNDFKQITGIKSNFALTLVGLWDQTLASTNLILSGINNMASVSNPDPVLTKRKVSDKWASFSWSDYEKSQEILFARNKTSGKCLMDEIIASSTNSSSLNGRSILDESYEDWYNSQVNVDEYLEKEQQEHEAGHRKRSTSFDEETKFGDVISSQDFNLGYTFGLAIHGSVKAWTSFNQLSNQLRDIHLGGSAWKRSVKSNELKPRVVQHEMERRRKRGMPFVNTSEFTFEEIAEMQGRYNALMIQSHGVVLMNFTRTVFFKFGDIFMQGFNNTFGYHPQESRENPFYVRRGIRNFLGTVWRQFNNEFGQKSIHNKTKTNGGNDNIKVSQNTLNNVFTALQQSQELKKRGMAPLSHPLVKHQQKETSIVFYPPETNELKSLLLKRSVLIEDNNVSNSGAAELEEFAIKNSVVVPLHEVIPITGKYYTIADQYLEKYNEMTILEKRDDLSHHFHSRQVFSVVSQSAPLHYEFGGEQFPLEDLCIGPSRTSSDLPPPFGNVPLPGFCFKCNLALQIVNNLVLYLAVAVNDTQDIFTRLDPSQARDPHARRQECNPCNIGPAEPSTVTCCGDCDCHTGVCNGTVMGACSLDQMPCCDANSSYSSQPCPLYTSVCINGTCSGIGGACTTNSDCGGFHPQTCLGAIVGHCGPASEVPKRDYPPVFSLDYSIAWQFWNFLWYIPGRLFDLTPTEAADAISNFFLVWDSEDPASIEYWITFAITCNPIEATHCDCFGRIQGTGLPWAILYVYGSIIGVSIIMAWVGLPSTLLLGLWLISIPLVISVAYFYSPRCTPLLPLCIFNDIRWYIYQWVRPCIDWTFLFGSVAVTPYCSYGVEQCYNLTSREYIPLYQFNGTECPVGTVFLNSDERYFPDCTEAPYDYDSQFKPLFVLVESVWPDFVNWLRFTNSPTLRYLRDLPKVTDGLQTGAFNPSGSLSPDHRACLIISGGSTILHLFSYSTLVTLGGVLAYYIVQFIVSVVYFIVDSLLFISIPIATLNASVPPPGFSSQGLPIANASGRRKPTLPARPRQQITDGTPINEDLASAPRHNSRVIQERHHGHFVSMWKFIDVDS